MSEKRYQEIGLKFTNDHKCTMGQMFGKPCLKFGKKAFVASFNEEMVFKLGREEVNLMKEKYPNAVNWDPSGKNRAMKDWIQVPNDYQSDWELLAESALAYIKASM